jgi:hypothetical protein
MGNTAVVTPAEVSLITRGGVYALQGVTAKFSKSGVNTCVCRLAVGRSETGDLVSLGFERGDEARITVSNALPVASGDAGTTSDQIIFGEAGSGYLTYVSSSFTLFEGVIDDFGPAALDFGNFAVQVVVRGEAAYLASGTFASSNVVTKSFLDTAVAPMFAQGTADNGQLDTKAAATDLWAEMQRTMAAIATTTSPNNDSLTAQIINFFGSDINALAGDAIAAAQGDLVWNPQARDSAAAIVLTLNQMMTREWYYESFLHRIIGFGEMLRFVTLETVRGVKVVPYIPFYLSTNARVISANTYSSIRWRYAPYQLYSGALLAAGAGQDAREQGGTGLVVGAYKMPGNPLGQVHSAVAPPYLVTVEDNIAVGGNGVRRVLPGARAVGDRLAKILTWELNYGNRSLQVTCPFLRSDIGPLEAVRVDFPRTAEIQAGSETPAFYGSVQTVTVTIDATEKTAATTYDIGFVRSYTQQKSQIDPDITAGEHPFFSTNYIGGRLDTGQTRTPSGQVT